jgi:hypothetical protein
VDQRNEKDKSGYVSKLFVLLAIVVDNSKQNWLTEGSTEGGSKAKLSCKLQASWIGRTDVPSPFWIGLLPGISWAWQHCC